jgi:DNA-directed RNA polymerase sigma subunit (sigma70/sigma32)
MAGSMSWIGGNDDNWPSDEGWPYTDRDDDVMSTDVGPTDGDTEFDDELVSLHAAAPHLFDDLAPIERKVVAGRFGLDGRPARSIDQLQAELGLPPNDLRTAYTEGLAKIRRHLR